MSGATAESYELMRLERIKRNREMLQSLDLESVKTELASSAASASAKASRKRPSQRGLGRSRKRGTATVNAPPRRSLRVRGKDPSGNDAPAGTGPAFAPVVSEERRDRTRYEGTIDADVEGQGDSEDEEEVARRDRARAFLRGLVGLELPKDFVSPEDAAAAGTGMKEESGDEKPDTKEAEAGKRAKDSKDLWEGLDVAQDSERAWAPAFMQHKPVPWPARPGPAEARKVGEMKDAARGFSIDEAGVAKATLDRTFSIAFLPCPDRAVVAVGDKNGRIGIWDTDVARAAAVEEEEEEAEEDGAKASTKRGAAPRKRGKVAEDDGVFLYRPHVRPIAGLEPHPTDRAQLFSASYDGSVRRMDFRRLASDDVLTLREDRRDYFTDLAWRPDGSQLAVGRGEGLVALYDPREPPTKARVVALHPKKVNTLHWHPTQPYLLSSSNDGTASVWDVRRFQLAKRSSDGNVGFLCDMDHGRSVCGAAFSPLGDRIVTVGMDDTVRVYTAPWEKEGEAPALVARTSHANNTGRWLSNFRPAFDPKHNDIFAVGAMRHPRAVDLFSAVDGRVVRSLQDGEMYQSSVTSLHAFHPYADILAGCNSSGRVFVWRVTE